MGEPEDWVKSGGWKHEFYDGDSILKIEAYNSGEIELAMGDADLLRPVYHELDLEDQRTLLRILVDNLEKHREALGGCPFAGIKFDVPCPLCDIADSVVVKTDLLRDAADAIATLDGCHEALPTGWTECVGQLGSRQTLRRLREAIDDKKVA